jgi:hypothetical protein
MTCPFCQEDLSILRYLLHRKSCRDQKIEKEYALMRERAIERLEQAPVRYTVTCQDNGG